LDKKAMNILRHINGKTTFWGSVFVFAVAASLLGVGIGHLSIASPFSDPYAKIRAQDESTYASSAMLMARGGDWLTPKVLGRFLLFKPPLLIWLSAASIRVFGDSLAALRLPAWIAGVGALCVLFRWAAVSNAMRGVLLAILLLSNPLWHTFSRLLYTDMPVVAATVCALALLRRDLRMERTGTVVGFAAFVALGVMFKNVAGLLPFLVLLLYTATARREMAPPIRRLVTCALLIVALTAPWHVYQISVHREWFWADYVKEQLLGFGLQPPQQSSDEGPVSFYLARLGATDPVLVLLFVLSLPGFLRELSRRTGESLLLGCWLGVVTAVLFLFRYRNLPYLLPLIPPLCLITVLYGKFTARNSLVWAALLCALFAVKTSVANRPWTLTFGGGEHLAAVQPLNYYASLKRPNDLLLINTDDEFYSLTLNLPRIRYCFIDPSGIVARYAPHLVYLGITLTEHEFDNLPVVLPAFSKRLRDWGLSSSEPVGSAILLKSVGDVEAFVNRHPALDFYLPTGYWPSGNHTTRVTARLPNGYSLLLAEPGSDR
jgi:hypothetical protein